MNNIVKRKILKLSTRARTFTEHQKLYNLKVLPEIKLEDSKKIYKYSHLGPNLNYNRNLNELKPILNKSTNHSKITYNFSFSTKTIDLFKIFDSKIFNLEQKKANSKISTKGIAHKYNNFISAAQFLFYSYGPIVLKTAALLLITSLATYITEKLIYPILIYIYGKLKIFVCSSAELLEWLNKYLKTLRELFNNYLNLLKKYLIILKEFLNHYLKLLKELLKKYFKKLKKLLKELKLKAFLIHCILLGSLIAIAVFLLKSYTCIKFLLKFIKGNCTWNPCIIDNLFIDKYFDIFDSIAVLIGSKIVKALNSMGANCLLPEDYSVFLLPEDYALIPGSYGKDRCMIDIIDPRKFSEYLSAHVLVHGEEYLGLIRGIYRPRKMPKFLEVLFERTSFEKHIKFIVPDKAKTVFDKICEIFHDNKHVFMRTTYIIEK